MKLLNVVGARPNLLKMAPLMGAYAEQPSIEAVLVHTGQHYDRSMSQLFFEELGIPEPSINLGVGSASHAEQTAAIMRAFEPVLLEERPDAVVVVGDVNSTIACGLVAVKLGVPLVHVEAGLRSFDRSMPEEINRLLTDAISDLLFCTEQSGVENLRRESVDGGRIHLVGNLMIDSLLRNLPKADESTVLSSLGVSSGAYAALTLHRPSNVDDPEVFSGILSALAKIQEEVPIVFPVHPRTRKMLASGPLAEVIRGIDGLRLVDPLGPLDFLKLMKEARVVLTDSGGIQEETTVLRVPCLTLRDNTERPVTLEVGSNQLVGSDPERILEGWRAALEGPAPSEVPPLWDGKTAGRIVEVLVEEYGG